MAGVSASYFALNRGGSPRERLWVAAHGIAGIVLYLGAFLVAWVDPNNYRPHLSIPYALLYLVPLALIVVAFRRFRGHWLVHALQGPNLLALLWALFVGSMAITGDWL
jgi:hypothetical protein